MWPRGNISPNSGREAAQPLAEVGAQLLYELVRMLQARPDEARLLRRAARLKERISVLENHVSFLASAVGMCSACLGTVAECPVCRGQGQPGGLTVDPGAFSEVVAPLFRRQPERWSELIAKFGTARQTVASAFEQPLHVEEEQTPPQPSPRSRVGNRDPIDNSGLTIKGEPQHA